MDIGGYYSTCYHPTHHPTGANIGPTSTKQHDSLHPHQRRAQNPAISHQSYARHSDQLQPTPPSPTRPSATRRASHLDQQTKAIAIHPTSRSSVQHAPFSTRSTHVHVLHANLFLLQLSTDTVLFGLSASMIVRTISTVLFSEEEKYHVYRSVFCSFHQFIIKCRPWHLEVDRRTS